MTLFYCVILGIISGFFAGMLGIGGGIIMVPALVMFFKLTQHQAQGTVMAVMLPPIMIFAFMKYYAAGNVNIKLATFIALGFLIGTFLGADLVQGIGDTQLKKIFAVLLILVGIRMFFQ